MPRISTFEKKHGRRPRVAIVGAGFGGLVAAKQLRNAPVDITLIDKRNYHLFQPLLYQVAVADLSPADVAWPIRGIFAHQRNLTVLMGKVEAIDTSAKTILTDTCEPVGYDYLILATGAQHSYFGKDEWADHAPGLKRLIDATDVRKRLLLAFERAEAARDSATRLRHMTFVIIGGGPTGVEMAGAIAELAHQALARDFRRINPKSARIVLIEGSDRLLRAFPPDLSAYTKAALEKLGVEIVLDERVTDVSDIGVSMGGETIPTSTVIWAAGVAASPVAQWLDRPAGDRAGRVAVDDRLKVDGLKEVFVIGDAALSLGWKGKPVPGIAPAAKQMGKHVARSLRHELGLGDNPGPFRYRHHGNLATIGRNSAAIDFGGIKLKGRLAWWLWGGAHISFLVGVRTPIIVAMQWFWAYLTAKKGARLIIGVDTKLPAPVSHSLPEVEPLKTAS